MFDIGFFEVCLIGIIALLVIGPEKLPRVARTTGLWLGKARGVVKTVKYEIDEQIRMEELKQSIDKANAKIKDVAEDIATPLQETVQNTKEDIDNLTSNKDKS